MGIIAWIVLGAIAGWITNMIMGGKEGVIATIILALALVVELAVANDRIDRLERLVVLGIVGGLVGGWLATNVFKMGSVDGINIESIIVAVIGAVIVVAVYRMVVGRQTGRGTV